jgi:hypothetical protein
MHFHARAKLCCSELSRACSKGSKSPHSRYRTAALRDKRLRRREHGSLCDVSDISENRHCLKVQPMTPDVSDCIVSYEGNSVSFQYPEVWELDEQIDEDDGSVLIMITVDDTCFWALKVMPECPSPTDVVESCVTGYREEYEEVEASQVNPTLAEMPATGRDVEFTCFELINTALLLSVRCEEFTLLNWWQGTDHELESLRPILDQMTSSVRIISFL